MLRRSAIFLGIALTVALGICAAHQKSKSQTTPRKPDLTTGKATFLQYCASCHENPSNRLDDTHQAARGQIPRRLRGCIAHIRSESRFPWLFRHASLGNSISIPRSGERSYGPATYRRCRGLHSFAPRQLGANPSNANSLQ
jgi:hypothetical protein